MSQPGILLLTGGTGSGKTMVLAEILRELGSSDIQIGGMLAPGRYLDSGEKEFDLELIPGGERYFLSTRIQYKGWEAIGGFRFNPEAVEAGLKHLLSLPVRVFELYLLDEIGPFELDDLLWASAIPGLIKQQVPMIWTVRQRIIEQVCIKWKIDRPEIINLESGKREEVLIKIRTWLKQNVQELS